MYTPGTIANSQTEGVPTKTNKNGAVAKVYQNFRGTRDTIRHLKKFRVISNEMPVFFVFFNCYLAAPWPNIGPLSRGQPHPMLITAFFYIFDPKVTGSLVLLHREPVLLLILS